MTDFLFLGSIIIVDHEHSHKIQRCLLLGRKVLTKLNRTFKSRDITMPSKVYIVMHGFFSSHVRMWMFIHKEGWEPKSWCFQTVLLENNLESPLDYKKITPVNPKGNQPWIFIGRTVAGCEKLTHWKRPWYWEKLRTGGRDDRGWNNSMASPTQWRWVWTPRDSEVQGSLICCGPWSHKELAWHSD